MFPPEVLDYDASGLRAQNRLPVLRHPIHPNRAPLPIRLHVPSPRRRVRLRGTLITQQLGHHTTRRVALKALVVLRHADEQVNKLLQRPPLDTTRRDGAGVWERTGFAAFTCSRRFRRCGRYVQRIRRVNVQEVRSEQGRTVAEVPDQPLVAIIRAAEGCGAACKPVFKQGEEVFEVARV